VLAVTDLKLVSRLINQGTSFTKQKYNALINSNVGSKADVLCARAKAAQGPSKKVMPSTHTAFYPWARQAMGSAL